MRKIQTEVLVIGGGATGTGVLFDLAQRGFKAVLLEKGDWTHGTTGRFHGLLHSGGRYAVKDPQAAKECIEENRILRRIMPHCIEDTGGYFVVTPWDDMDYAVRFLAGCRQSGIPVEEISYAEMLRQEPLLNPEIVACYRVPDASADSFSAAHANIDAAKSLGAQAFNYHQVTQLLFQNGEVIGASCQDLVKDEEVQIFADMIVNASGAWAGKIAALADVRVRVRPGKGTMIAASQRIVNTVINRCKMPSDGDILVPAHTVVVIGTTDVHVDDPDNYSIDPWEVHLMLEEGEKLIPGFRKMRMLRAWAGVRPLYQEENVDHDRDITRAFVLLDHEVRDGVKGLLTITSGKWTTYRRMAEVTVNHVCQKLGTERLCRTHIDVLPAAKNKRYHRLGERLQRIESSQDYGNLICECEIVTRQDVIASIQVGGAKTIDDIRRDTRLGMGPCQGGFCTLRAAGILQAAQSATGAHINASLKDFLFERWKGLLPVLWGQQLRQERFDEFIYIDLLNVMQLPGPQYSKLKATPYLRAPRNEEAKLIKQRTRLAAADTGKDRRGMVGSKPEVLVIGAGLAGLTAALSAAQANKTVRVVSKGMGALYWHTGCIDVFGYAENSEVAQSPRDALVNFITKYPDHPYALLGINKIEESLQWFVSLCDSRAYPLLGSIDRNIILPTAVGSIRPTCLAPETMVAGDLSVPDPMLIVGFENFLDFYPQLIATNLNSQGIPADSLILDMPELQTKRFVYGKDLAGFFEREDFCESVANKIKARMNGATKRVGFPAVLGLNNPLKSKAILEKILHAPVFEIPTLPPSIPGIRLSNLLRSAISELRGHIYDGMDVIQSESNQGDDGPSRITAVWSEAAARNRKHRAINYILASGGVLGGGLKAHYSGEGIGYLDEPVFKLPIDLPSDRSFWFNREFLSADPHPINLTGIVINQQCQPIDAQQHVIYDNLYAAGNILASRDPFRALTFEGIALSTGYFVGKQI